MFMLQPSFLKLSSMSATIVLYFGSLLFPWTPVTTNFKDINAAFSLVSTLSTKFESVISFLMSDLTKISSFRFASDTPGPFLVSKRLFLSTCLTPNCKFFSRTKIFSCNVAFCLYCPNHRESKDTLYSHLLLRFLTCRSK